jgi:coiled-coil domain-containing protein 12
LWRQEGVIKFRNYRPAAEVAPTKNEEQPPATGKEGTKPQGTVAGGSKPAAKQASEAEDIIKAELKRHMEETGVGGEQLSVAPKKPNWDLKRDVSKKLDKLNRMTQKAIVEMLREKLAQEAEDDSDEEAEE